MPSGKGKENEQRNETSMTTILWSRVRYEMPILT